MIIRSTPRRTKFPANLVGSQIRRLRVARGWSQSKFVVKLQLNGLDIRRDVLGQMEAQLHCISDNEIAHIALVLHVRESDLFVGIKLHCLKVVMNS